jgi:hypothetical protein
MLGEGQALHNMCNEDLNGKKKRVNIDPDDFFRSPNRVCNKDDLGLIMIMLGENWRELCHQFLKKELYVASNK